MVVMKFKGVGRVHKPSFTELLMSDRVKVAMDKFLLCLFAVFAILAMLSAAAHAAPVHVTGRGPTAVLARRDAFRQAVEQRVGVLIASKTVVVNSSVTLDKVIASSAGLVTGYALVDAGVDQLGYWAVMDVDVDDQALQSACAASPVEQGLVRANLDDPRVCVRVHGGPAWATSELVTMLHQAGFSRVSTGRRGPEGFDVDCYLGDVRVTRPTSWGFEHDFTATCTASVRVTDNQGDVAMQRSASGSAWSTTAADTQERAQRAALVQVSKELGDWLHTRARTAERHLRVVVHGMNAVNAQALAESTSGVARAYVRVVRDDEVHLEVDADCGAIDLAVAIETEHPDMTVFAFDGSVHAYTGEAIAQRERAKAKCTTAEQPQPQQQPAQMERAETRAPRASTAFLRAPSAQQCDDEGTYV